MAANSAGVCGGADSMPNLRSCSRNSGVDWIRCSSAASFATIAGGVAAGATMPCQASQSKPLTVAAIGGTPGTSVVGFADEVPSGVTFPAWMFGTATVASANIICTPPLRRSGIAACVPL